MDALLKYLPAIFAIAGLILFITAQFYKGIQRLVLSFFGILLIGLFAYKLFILREEAQFTTVYTNRSNSSFSFLSVFVSTVAINIAGFILWLMAILKATFEKSIPKQNQLSIIVTGGIIIIAALVIYKLLGGIVSAICFPILTIGYFIAFFNYYRKIKINS